MPEEQKPGYDPGVASSLEEVRARLYGRVAPGAFKESTLRPEAPMTGVPHSWDEEPIAVPKKMSFAVKFLIAAVGFFVLAGGASAFLLFHGTHSVSTDHITLRMTGAPTTIASGDTVTIPITIENHNPSAITPTSIRVDFPPGTLTADAKAGDKPDSLARYTNDQLAEIASGESVKVPVRAVLYGTESQTLTMPITFEYKIAGSNAVFVKEAQYTVTVTSSPVALSVHALSEIAPGQPFTLEVTIRSNAPAVLNNVAVSGAYPFGFTPTASNPAPTSGSFFRIGTLNPGDERTIQVTGTLSGQQGDERAFRFNVGTAKNEQAQSLDATFTTQEATIAIAKPFLAVTLSLNHDTSDTTIVNAGDSVQGLVSWQNALSQSIANGQITVALTGDAYDRTTVSTIKSFYRSTDNTISFSSDTNSELALLAPGDSGNGSFTFRMKPAAALSQMRSPSITFTVSVAGKRTSETGVPESVTSTITRTIKVATNLTLASRSVHASGPIKNTGPIPPVPDTETQYTIMLNSGTSVNAVGGAVATMTLPSYVRFTGATNPADGSIVYDATKRIVTWNIGDVTVGSPRTAAFQVALLPSVSQRGTSPVLVNAGQITGLDRFTRTNVNSTFPAVDTRITTDPGYTFSQGELPK